MFFSLWREGEKHITWMSWVIQRNTVCTSFNHNLDPLSFPIWFHKRSIEILNSDVKKLKGPELMMMFRGHETELTCSAAMKQMRDVGGLAL